MFFDHVTMTATNSQSEPERLGRVYGYVMALADLHASTGLVEKVT